MLGQTGDEVEGGQLLRILIADDHDLLRDTLVLYLRNEGGIQAVSVPDLHAVERLMDGGRRSTSCCSTSRCRAWTASRA